MKNDSSPLSRLDLDLRLPRLLQCGVERGQILGLQRLPRRQGYGERLPGLVEAAHGIRRRRVVRAVDGRGGPVQRTTDGAQAGERLRQHPPLVWRRGALELAEARLQAVEGGDDLGINGGLAPLIERLDQR